MGWDVLTHAIVVLVIVDYLTGIGKTPVQQQYIIGNALHKKIKRKEKK